MSRSLYLGAAAVLTALATALAAPMSFAQSSTKHHDSNTLHKIGKAVQYPVNKAAQNASVDVHRAEGKKSVVHRRNGNRTHNTVVTPSGRLHRISRTTHHRRTHHRRTHSRHHRTRR